MTANKSTSDTNKTEQAAETTPRKQRRPSFGKNGVPTPPGFEAHPERRHNGAWKKENTPRFKLEQMMKLTEDELKAVVNDTKASLFERKLAVAIRKGSWKEIEAMINQVYGKPKETVENTVKTGFDSLAPEALGIILKSKNGGDGDDNEQQQ